MTAMGTDNHSGIDTPSKTDFDTADADANATSAPDPMIKGRYVLHHCLSTTSLMALYWAHDEQAEEPDALSDVSDKNLLLAIINPAISQLDRFENTLRTNWAYFALPKLGQPHVVDYGKESGGQLWFAMRDTNGLLLSERLQELDDRSLPADTANRIAHAIYLTAQSLQDKPYGFLEPGIIQKSGDDTYKLLNAPVVRTLQQVLDQQHEQKLALHSPYLSPSVAVGDVPTTEDDSFAIAAIFYELLTHQAPFGKRSTLEAAVHGDAPHTVKKLNEKQWQVLKSALALQRSPRPANPGTLLKQLNGKQRSRILYPVAAAVALGIIAFAAYHLISKVDEALPATVTSDSSAASNASPEVTKEATIPSDITPTESTPASTEAPDTPSENLAAIEAEAAKATETTETIPKTNSDITSEITPDSTSDTEEKTEDTAGNTTDTEINALLEKAQQAIQNNQLIHKDTSKQTATRYLQQVLAKSPDHQGAQTLLTDLISAQHKQVTTALEAEKYAQAEQQLETTDAIISEFALADFLIPQARLEATLENQLRKQTMIAQYLTRAKAAIKRDKLSNGDEEGESAVDYLRALMLEVPDHPEGKRLLKDIVNRQHRQARKLIRKKDLEAARAVLDSSQRIIGRYRFDELAEKQLQLEDGYRDRQLGANTLPAASTGNTTATTERPRPQERDRTATPAPTTTTSTRRSEREQPAPAPIASRPATPPAVTAPVTTAAPATATANNDDGLMLLPMPDPQVSYEVTETPPNAVTPPTPTTPTPTPPAPQAVAPASALEGMPSILPDDAIDYALPAINNPEPAPEPITPITISTPSPVVSYEAIESTNNVQIPDPVTSEPDIPEIPLSIIDDGLPVLPLPLDDTLQ